MKKATAAPPVRLVIGFLALLILVPHPLLFAESGQEDYRIVTVQSPVGKIFIRPSTHASVVDTLKKGDSVTLIAQETEWFVIKLEDARLGWVHKSIFDELTAPPPTEPDTGLIPKAAKPPARLPDEKKAEAVVKVPSGRVRRMPSQQADVVAGIQKGETVSVLSRKGKWYQILTSDGSSGWVYHTLIRVTTEGEIPENVQQAAAVTGTMKTGPSDILFEAVSKIDFARVRKAPNFKADIQFKLSRGETVAVLETRDDWFHIRLKDGRTGWAHQLLFSRDQSKKIESIRFETDPSSEAEKVLISLSGFFPPKTFALDDEDIPKVVCDFFDAEISGDIAETIPVNGRLLRKIRIGTHRKPRLKIRVVLDLEPEKKYGVEQVFYKQRNLYSLTFKPIKE